MLGALARGETHIRGLLDSEDVARTTHCLKEMGVPIWPKDAEVTVEGQGEAGLTAPLRTLDAGNSGTTLRLLMGVVASYPIAATFTGHASLQKRPMDRVAIPLRQMGAEVEGQGARCTPPVTVRGGALKAIEYEMPMASAQLKSALLLAGLRAEGETWVNEPGLSRDHTERMLKRFGARVKYGPGFASIEGGNSLKAQSLTVPGDFSAAAFFIVGAAIAKGSELHISGVGLNPARIGLLEVLAEMGADFDVMEPMKECRRLEEQEPGGSIIVRGEGELRGCRIGDELIPRLIDEFPILCIAAACAQGKTEVRGAEELRVKESDRIASMAAVLRALGADAEELPDGLIINGGKPLTGARIDCQGDHRVAMAAAIAGLATPWVEIAGAECIATSYPNFIEDFRRSGAQVEVVE